MEETDCELSPVDMLAKARTDMNLFNEQLAKIEASEKNHYHQWWLQYQEVISWEAYKARGFADYKVPTDDKEKSEKEGKKLGFVPTELARTSPFFPISRAEMSNRPLYYEFVVENKWGKLTISGPQLCTQDETVLLALLCLTIKNKKSNLTTDFPELCELCAKGRGSTQYKSIRECLERMTKVVVGTEEYDSTSTKIKKTLEINIGAILSHVKIIPDTKKIEVSINQYFLDKFALNLTTGIDIDKRSLLNGDIAKSLYRFLETHDQNKFPYSLLTLCHAINLNIDRPLGDIRKVLRKALKELEKYGIVKKGSKIDPQDMVHIKK